MRFILPRRDAGDLAVNRHGAAVIGAVSQVRLEQAGVAGDKAGTQARQVGALGQTVEHHATGKVVAAHGSAGLQQADRGRAVWRVDLAVALVGGNDKVVLVGQLDQLLQGFQRDDRAGRVARGADEE